MNETSSPLELIAVAAMSSNRVIGQSGTLPWHIPEDLQFFKQLTSGHPVIMGRKTFESIGHPLPNRLNVIISTSLKTAPEGTLLLTSIDRLSEPDACLNGKVFVIGGAQLYTSLMQQIGEIYLSYIYANHEGDVFFPEFEDDFAPYDVIRRYEIFEVRRYLRRSRA